MKKEILKIKDLYVSVNGNTILNGLNFSLNEGDIQVVMGPNGSGKSTFAEVLMGSFEYTVDYGEILLFQKDIKDLQSYKRAKMGLFLAFQHPIEVPGVNFGAFLHSAYKSIKNEDISIFEFIIKLKREAKNLGIEESFISRNLNEGLSGGEKKRMEILQIAVLKPKVVILDEIDSGLDIDGIKFVSNSINLLNSQGVSFIIITHQRKLLDSIEIDKVNLMHKGAIVKSSDETLIKDIEKRGYRDILKYE
jgi:Fe-S cluster assembly ATP-binding protein